MVAGLGGFGSATARHLAARGRRVLGLDPHPPGHALGASPGETRIVRQAYYEGPAYVPLLRRGAQLWEWLARDAGEPMLVTSGGLFLGRPGTRIFDGSLATARAWDLPHEVLDAAEVTRRWPVLRPPSGTCALFEPTAGVVPPERAVRAHLRLAAAAGAELRHGVPLVGWEPLGEGVRVQTGEGVVEAGALVLTGGRWSAGLAGPGGADLALRVEPRTQHWFRPAGDVSAYEIGRLPLWMWDRDDGTAVYGLPAMGTGEVKASVHYSSVRPAGEWTAADVSALVDPLLPGMTSTHLRSADCSYTMTPDEHFVVGRHPSCPAVVLGCGFSGHGFKFTPVLGEVLADLATGVEPAYDLSTFHPGRFAPAGR